MFFRFISICVCNMFLGGVSGWADVRVWRPKTSWKLFSGNNFNFCISFSCFNWRWWLVLIVQFGSLYNAFGGLRWTREFRRQNGNSTRPVASLSSMTRCIMHLNYICAYTTIKLIKFPRHSCTLLTLTLDTFFTYFRKVIGCKIEKKSACDFLNRHQQSFCVCKLELLAI